MCPETFKRGKSGLLIGNIRLLTVFEYVLVGVTSWGYGCGETPGVYCEVADHVDWINRITAQFP